MGGEVRGGTLYIVSTPIGNLEDITLRAIRVLTDVDVVAAEDTRKTGLLLRHLGLKKEMVSYHGYNERARIPGLVGRMVEGKSVGLVTDAGTPGISDPAYMLIKAAIAEKVPVVPLPGPTAFVPALVVSGLPIDRFVFEGFLPGRKGRQKRLSSLSNEDRTIVLYESPHRLVRTLRDLFESLGERDVAIVRELTKSFEEIVRGKLSELVERAASKKPRGEYVIVIGGTGAGRSRRQGKTETSPGGC